jgi:ATP-dependent protease ClpP protease subunit
MGNVVVIGAGSQWARTTLARSIGSILAMAASESKWRSSWSRSSVGYQNSHIHKQMGWVSALHKDMRTQQRRKSIHQFHDNKQRQKKASRKIS